MTNKPMLNDERLATQKFAIANALIARCGQPLTPDVINQITDELKTEMTTGPTSWAFSPQAHLYPAEPVYQIHRFENAGWRDADKDAYESAKSLNGYTTRVLYQHAEQTAPVRTYDEGYDAGLADGLSELSINQPAPVAVVMPERLEVETGYSLNAANWYNLALDDVARLNGVKP